MRLAICPFCGVGCELLVDPKSNKIKSVSGISSKGKLCLKGVYSNRFISSHNRLIGSYISEKFLKNLPNSLKKEIKLQEKVKLSQSYFYKITYEDAAFIVAKKIKEIKEKYNQNAFGFIGGARTNCESVYLFQKFAREVINTNNIDNCARVCHSPSLKGLYDIFGTGASSISYKDLEDTQVIFIIGANPAEAHPVIFQRILEAKKKKDITLICIDIIKTKTYEKSDIKILIPPLFNIPFLRLIAFHILSKNLSQKNFLETKTRNYKKYFEIVKKEKDLLLAFFKKYAPHLISISEKLAQIISQKRTCFLWGLGVSEHKFGSNTVMEIAHLSLLTGNIAKKGAGVMPLRGQNNVQGACDMGALPNYYPGYKEIPKEKEGLKTPEMIRACLERKLKFLWVMGEDLLHSHADIDLIDKALDNLEILVVNDIFPVKIIDKADIVFGVKSTYEKDGIYINAERRVHLSKAVYENNFLLDDWEVIQLVENKLQNGFSYKSSKEIWKEVSHKVKIFKDITYDLLERDLLNPPSWPGKENLFEDGFFTKDKKAHFMPFSIKKILSYINEKYNNLSKDEFILTTTRIYEHYNICSQTLNIEPLKKYKGKIYTILASDKDKDKFKNTVYLYANGKKVGPFKVEFTSKVPKGMLVAYLHHPEINRLFSMEGDIYTLTYAFKFLPVKVKEI